MIDGALPDHPLRHPLTAELHARPFTEMAAPGRAFFLALKPAKDAALRDEAEDAAHLAAFVAHHGGSEPGAVSNHHFADLGIFRLKWERHTEFVGYTLYESGAAGELFAGNLAKHFPAGWLADQPGRTVAAIQFEVLTAPDAETAAALVGEALMPYFARESMACAALTDGEAIGIGDFQIHPDGFSRFALVIHGDPGPRRIGRAVQRLIEMDVYRILAMMALPTARRVSARLGEIERDLSALVSRVGGSDGPEPESEVLERLTALSAEIETLATDAAFRFGASGAYETIVAERIEMLRETRIMGWQQFAEFMARRFDPAMRTVHAAERRLVDLATRAGRIAELLRTRVSVAVETQNQELLESMNRRAALQLRLQATVEGLSVVAISYYAVNLVGYLLAPAAKEMGTDKTTISAISVVPVVALVWWMIRRMRRRIDRGG